jgi:hypothetical protein
MRDKSAIMAQIRGVNGVPLDFPESMDQGVGKACYIAYNQRSTVTYWEQEPGRKWELMATVVYNQQTDKVEVDFD